ncbi:ABC transporter permease [Pararhizobium mangrovi]|uniref:ABC transporter permease n=1 Tax=Pararhizobium mangrovi TaxID=2590452 RepID=A0A506TX88_9HYPH|nr:ABC transporter permease [Pararhizobium mangrovi]TPW25768.1 ABC transporter permease [Pararhizobium mangrovi]
MKLSLASEGAWKPEPSLMVGVSLFIPLLLVIVLLVVYPFIELVRIAMPDGIDPASFRDYFDNAARMRALIVTFRDSAAVAILAVLMGFVLAWTLITSKSTVLKALTWIAIALPLLMGTVVKNYALLIILQRRGLLNNFLIHIGVIDAPLRILYTESAVVVGILYTLLPYAIIPIYTALRSLDFDMVRSAEIMGASRFTAIRTVVLPYAWPSIMASAMLIFVISVGFYIVPVVLGGATSPFIATLIQNDMVQFFDMKSAAIASLILVMLSMAAVALTIATVGVDQVNRSTGAGQ